MGNVYCQCQAPIILNKYEICEHLCAVGLTRQKFANLLQVYFTKQNLKMDTNNGDETAAFNQSIQLHGYVCFLIKNGDY